MCPNSGSPRTSLHYPAPAERQDQQQEHRAASPRHQRCDLGHPRYNGTATVQLALLEAVIPINQNGPLRRDLGETNVQCLKRDLESLNDGTKYMKVDPLIADSVAQRITRNQKLTCEAIRLLPNRLHVIDDRVHVLLVSAEAW